jgi:hypothetical protein
MEPTFVSGARSQLTQSRRRHEHDGWYSVYYMRPNITDTSHTTSSFPSTSSRRCRWPMMSTDVSQWKVGKKTTKVRERLTQSTHSTKSLTGETDNRYRSSEILRYQISLVGPVCFFCPQKDLDNKQTLGRDKGRVTVLYQLDNVAHWWHP